MIAGPQVLERHHVNEASGQLSGLAGVVPIPVLPLPRMSSRMRSREVATFDQDIGIHVQNDAMQLFILF